jgi:hypothetical protein
VLLGSLAVVLVGGLIAGPLQAASNMQATREAAANKSTGTDWEPREGVTLTSEY